jgi:hypothetical protein
LRVARGEVRSTRTKDKKARYETDDDDDDENDDNDDDDENDDNDKDDSSALLISFFGDGPHNNVVCSSRTLSL